MRRVSQTGQFAKDLKRLARRGKNLDKLKEVIRTLSRGESLEPRHGDHALGGKWSRSRDCHIEWDWILIYTVEEGSLRLERTGTHRDLFR
ncbi:MAG: type II toxin-antitoxin system mRNA interferase toxin, RelE/StbE family [Armatimonadetes bacterium CG07_land_8_20_14_0_80_59_28]|nr:MAG: type II toxin-antitoxin system mRNA interferase toxin, RelE/StbE family [Armatimonadetes bacterium CG07_land_8_20_14_0_80_59_28]